MPKWLARARDGANDDDDDDGDDDDDAPPRTRNEIASDDGGGDAGGGDRERRGDRGGGDGWCRWWDGRWWCRARGATRRAARDGSGRRDETLDEESVLCTRDRRGLGAIEEVFGPVSAPLYALRLPEEVTAEDGGRGVRRRRAVEEDSKRREVV